jgi:hypothetical protein
MANRPNSDQTVGPEEDIPRRCMACPDRGDEDDLFRDKRGEEEEEDDDDDNEGDERLLMSSGLDVHIES